MNPTKRSFLKAGAILAIISAVFMVFTGVSMFLLVNSINEEFILEMYKMEYQYTKVPELDGGYHIHILGFGNEQDISEINSTINAVSSKTACMVSYDGCLSGEEYEKFIQRCHIGLSTQNPQADFNDTSFPSKIFTYMANGLQVVSADIPVVRTSAVNEYMNYYSEQTPQGIANAIKSVPDLSEFDPREVINKLNSDFKNDIMTVIQEKI